MSTFAAPETVAEIWLEMVSSEFGVPAGPDHTCAKSLERFLEETIAYWYNLDMARPQIIEKVDAFLADGLASTEHGVVYLLVELRKILDHAYDRQADFTLLRFYCDWIVHTEKSRNLQHIAPVIQQVYDDLKRNIETAWQPPAARDEIVKFIYMDDLKNEMEDLFQREELSPALFADEAWANFLGAVVQVLTDQPIINPTDDVSEVRLVPARPGCVCGRIQFSHPITGHDGRTHPFCEFGNTY